MVESTYLEGLDVAPCADALGVTPAMLNRRLKDELGQTALQIINDDLAIGARAALESGMRSMKEVAFELGFNDPLCFYCFLKKQFVASPAQYFQDPLLV